MANISKKKIKKEVLLEIHKYFIESIIKIKNKERSTKFFNELFTQTERIVLAKRLALILMLAQDFPTGYIQKTLKISRTTIITFNKKLKVGKFASFQSMIDKKRKKKEKLDRFIEMLLSLADLPPIAGPGRWKHLNKMYNNKK